MGEIPEAWSFIGRGRVFRQKGVSGWREHWEGVKGRKRADSEGGEKGATGKENCRWGRGRSVWWWEQEKTLDLPFRLMMTFPCRYYRPWRRCWGLGLLAGEQVMSLYREWLTAHCILGSKELSQAGHGRRVRAAGLLAIHQSPPTAKGFHFLTLENQDDLMNVKVAPGVYGRYRSVIRGVRLLVAAGSVQQEEGVANLLAECLAPLPGLRA